MLATCHPPTSRTAAGLLAESSVLADETGDLCARVMAAVYQALQAWQRGELPRARASVEAGLVLAQRLTEPYMLRWALQNLAYVATDEEDPAASGYVARALVSARAGGVTQSNLVEGLALTGLHALLEARPGEAAAAAVEGLQLTLVSGARAVVDVWCLEVLACAWTAQGQRPEQAARLLGAVAHAREVAATARLRRLAALVEQAGAVLLGVLGAAAFAAAYEAGYGLSPDEAMAEALTVAVAGGANNDNTVA